MITSLITVIKSCKSKNSDVALTKASDLPSCKDLISTPKESNANTYACQIDLEDLHVTEKIDGEDDDEDDELYDDCMVDDRLKARKSTDSYLCPVQVHGIINRFEAQNSGAACQEQIDADDIYDDCMLPNGNMC